MSELVHIRRDCAHGADFPGHELQRLAVNEASLTWLDEATWLGDFSTPGYGFGHVKVLRRPDPPGSLKLGGDSLYILAVCDGFHRGMLAKPDLHMWIFAAAQDWKEDPPEATASQRGYGEVDFLLRRENSWQHEWSNGRNPDLQIAAVHLHCTEIASIANNDDEIAFYFGLQNDQQRAYINLDGVPEKNFSLPKKFFA